MKATILSLFLMMNSAYALDGGKIVGRLLSITFLPTGVIGVTAGCTMAAKDNKSSTSIPGCMANGSVVLTGIKSEKELETVKADAIAYQVNGEESITLLSVVDELQEGLKAQDLDYSREEIIDLLTLL
ncbi:MAG: hypothetical protein AB7I27_00940 [Bacteriovoracaceae bacterium]